MSKEEDKKIAKRLKEIRTQRNMSQQDLAKKSDLHFSRISRYERGISTPNTDTLKKLADALGVSTDHILEGKEIDVAKAKFEDQDILRMFKELEQLPEEDKMVVRKVLDAILTKRKLIDMAENSK